MRQQREVLHEAERSEQVGVARVKKWVNKAARVLPLTGEDASQHGSANGTDRNLI